MNLSPSEIVNRMLIFIGLSNVVNHIFSTRWWKQNRQKFNTDSRGFVVKFSSPIIRNEILKKIKSLRNLNSHNIFGVNDFNRIYVTDLLPKHSYLLLLKARKMYKLLN